MQVKSVVDKNNLYIRLSGELDQGVAESARRDLDAFFTNKTYRNVVFDMSDLNFMDSTGIGLILSRYKKLKKQNVPVYITAPNPQIDKIIRVSGLYTIMPLI